MAVVEERAAGGVAPHREQHRAPARLLGVVSEHLAGPAVARQACAREHGAQSTLGQVLVAAEDQADDCPPGARHPAEESSVWIEAARQDEPLEEGACRAVNRLRDDGRKQQRGRELGQDLRPARSETGGDRAAEVAVRRGPSPRRRRASRARWRWGSYAAHGRPSCGWMGETLATGVDTDSRLRPTHAGARRRPTSRASSCA